MAPTQRRSKLRVCVVDDNHDSADSLALLLQLAGHEVHTSYDAATTLTLARDVHPDCVISDINMPGMDGCELARQVKTEHPEVRLIAVTGRNDDAQTDLVREAGFDYQFTKPADPTVILEVLAMMQ